MDPLRIIEKLTLEIIDQKTPDPDFIHQRLIWVFVAGWEEGIQHHSKRKPVIQMDQYGNIIKIHRSIKDAKNAVGSHRSSIENVCRGKKNSCKGFHWRYVEDPKQIKKILEGWQKKL